MKRLGHIVLGLGAVALFLLLFGNTYAEWLEVVETTDEWQHVNEVACRNFATLPAFLRDEKLMRAKLSSPFHAVSAAAEQCLKFPPKPE